MRRYETIVIVDSDVSEDDRTSLFTRIKEIIPQQGGVLIAEDLWGAKKLAYPIKKKPRGYYARFDYCGMGPAVDEMERFFRIDDRVMKYLTVQLDPDADAEQILADRAAAEAPAEPETSTEETPDADEPAETPEASADAGPEAPAASTEAPAVETATETKEKE